MKRILLALLLLTLLPSCTTSPTGRKQLMLISPETAIVESKKAYLGTTSALDKDGKLVTDPAMSKRVADITGRLVTVAIEKFPKTADWEWSVAIIDDPETVNAWCMAGGRMAVYTGLFEKLDLNDDEFAQIMGHEISHALANHTAERMSRAMATTAGIMAVGIAVEDHRIAAMGAAAMAAKMALELPNSRTAESEADRMGMELATLAGYRPEAAVSLWQKMGAQGGGSRPPEFLSTHPAPGNRQAELGAMVDDMERLNPNRTRAAIHPIQIMK